MPSNIRNHFPTRIKFCCAQTRPFGDQEYAKFLRKWTDLSEYVREIKQTFSRYFKKRHNRRGFFWGERFKSLIVEDGLTPVNLLAYIDLNPLRAGIVKRPEDYRWCSLGYNIQTGNKDDLLCVDFGMQELTHRDRKLALYIYSVFVYAFCTHRNHSLPEVTYAPHRPFYPRFAEYGLSRYIQDGFAWTAHS